MAAPSTTRPGTWWSCRSEPAHPAPSSDSCDPTLPGHLFPTAFPHPSPPLAHTGCDGRCHRQGHLTAPKGVISRNVRTWPRSPSHAHRFGSILGGVCKGGSFNMAQNTSHAVMAQRTESPDSLDDFPTPPWATRAFVEHVLGGKTSTSGLHVFHTDAWWSGYDLATTQETDPLAPLKHRPLGFRGFSSSVTVL